MTRIRSSLAIAVLPGLLAGGVATAQSLPRIPVPPKQFAVVRTDRIHTSGGELIGLVGGNPSSLIDRPTVAVSGIEPSDRVICVTIRQIDGGYSARFKMANPQRGRRIAFDLPSGMISVRGVPTIEMAILARASTGQGCGDTDPILPAAWAAPASTRLVALINDHSADRSRPIQPSRAPSCRSIADQLPGRPLNLYQRSCDVVLMEASCKANRLALEVDHNGKLTYIEGTVRDTCP